jgi:rubrerythrin
MAGQYFVERKLADNVFALGPNNRRVRYYDYVKTPYECWLIDTGVMKESCEKSLPEDVTIESLVETLEENEDEVECKTCFNLFPKADCTKGDHGYTCSTCSAPSEDPFNQDFPEVADYVVSDTEVGLAIADLVVDEFEAIGGYETVDELVQHARIPEDKKEEIIDTLDHIRKEEEEHVDELKELSTTAEPEVAEPAVVEEPVLLPEEEAAEQPIDEDLEWHTYKITFSTKANPDSEHTTTFKTWQSDVEYAWRMSNANIPHTTIKSIELVEDVNQEPDSVHDLGNEYDGGYPEEKPLLPEADEDEI